MHKHAGHNSTLILLCAFRRSQVTLMATQASTTETRTYYSFDVVVLNN